MEDNFIKSECEIKIIEYMKFLKIIQDFYYLRIIIFIINLLLLDSMTLT